jgi:hypothetical protein
LDSADDLSGIRKALLLVLAEHQPLVHEDVEDAARPLDQLRLDSEGLTQLVCQADRLAVVVSRFAPNDPGHHDLESYHGGGSRKYPPSGFRLQCPGSMVGVGKTSEVPSTLLPFW